MKVLAVSMLVLLGVTMTLAKSCSSNGDCGDGECCAGMMPWKGTCKSFTKEGKTCLEDGKTFGITEVHILYCPCEDELECIKPEGAKPKDDKGTCQKPAEETTTEEETTTQEETTTVEEETTTVAEETTTSNSGENNSGDSGEATTKDSNEDNSSEVEQ